MKALICGATGGLGRSLAEELARKGYALMLQGRCAEDLERLASDLQLIYNVDVEILRKDLSQGWSEEDINSCRNGDLTLIAFTLAMTDPFDKGELSPEQRATLWQVNVQSVVHLTEELLPGLRKSGGTIIACGSIASFRGRGTNMVYAASKSALETYFEGLAHLEQDSSINVHYYRLGYLNTRNTADLSTPIPMLQPERLSRTMVSAIGKKRVWKTSPWFWLPIGWILKALPWNVYRRLKF